MATLCKTAEAPPRTLTSFFIGQPLPSHEAPHQTISKKVGLAVFASDALSSTAYATEAILEVLAFAVPVAGAAVLGYSLPVSIAIVALLAVVTISYQPIRTGASSSPSTGSARSSRRRLSLESYGAPPRIRRNRVLLLIGGMHSGVLHALHYGRILTRWRVSASRRKCSPSWRRSSCPRAGGKPPCT